MRHAQASRIDVTVTVTAAAASLQLDVSDNGRGRLEDLYTPGHFGVPGMRERAQALGGRFDLLQTEPCGVHIRVSLPINRQIEGIFP